MVTAIGRMTNGVATTHEIATLGSTNTNVAFAIIATMTSRIDTDGTARGPLGAGYSLGQEPVALMRQPALLHSGSTGLSPSSDGCFCSYGLTRPRRC